MGCVQGEGDRYVASIFARRMVLLAGLLQVLFCTCQGLANGPFEKATHLLRSYCVGCHGKDLAEAQVDLESIAVDHAIDRTQTKQPGQGITRLSERRHSAQFDKTETQGAEPIHSAGMFV